MKNLPKDLVAPPRRGPRPPHPSAGAHAQGVRRQRDRGAQRRAALQRERAL